MDESITKPNTKSNLRTELYSLTAVRNEIEDHLMYRNKCKENIQANLTDLEVYKTTIQDSDELVEIEQDIAGYLEDLNEMEETIINSFKELDEIQNEITIKLRSF